MSASTITITKIRLSRPKKDRTPVFLWRPPGSRGIERRLLREERCGAEDGKQHRLISG